MEKVFKEYSKKTEFKKELGLLEPPPKRKRTSEDFVSFCEFILEYENYEAIKQEELRQKNSSPLGSTSSNDDSHHGKHTDNESDEEGDRVEGGDDSWDLITCYCMKPFAGRPMIECSECQTWIHLSCAKIRRNNIPENFVCQTCRDAKLTTRRSQRVRSESRRIFL